MEKNTNDAARSAVEELLSASGLEAQAKGEARNGIEALLKARKSVTALQVMLPEEDPLGRQKNLEEVVTDIDMALTDLACACSAFKEEFAYVIDEHGVRAGTRIAERDLTRILVQLKRG